MVSVENCVDDVRDWFVADFWDLAHLIPDRGRNLHSFGRVNDHDRILRCDDPQRVSHSELVRQVRARSYL